MPIADKVAYADIVIDNSGSLQELEVHVNDLVSKLNKEVGWAWRLSWLVPPFAVISAASLLLWKWIKGRKRARRVKRE